MSCHSERGPAASASGRGAALQAAGQPQRRHGEGGAVDEQRRRRAEDGDQRAGRQEADHLGQLQRDVGQRGGDGVAVAVQHVGHQRRAGRLERWRAQRDQEEQRQQHRQRRARDRHQRRAARPRATSAAIEHPVAGQPVGQRGQQRAAEQPRQVADREGQRRQQRRGGALVDQHGQRHPGELVAGGGEQERAEQRPELRGRRRPRGRSPAVAAASRRGACPRRRRGRARRGGPARVTAGARARPVSRLITGKYSQVRRAPLSASVPCTSLLPTERDRCARQGRRAGRRPARPSG